MSYPDVHVTNSTKFSITGTVHYAACSSDDFNIASGTDWSHSRGVCLITKITAQVYLPNGPVDATSYESSGTSYSQYAVIEYPPGSYAVTRVVNMIGNDHLLIKSGLKTSAAFYGIKETNDTEAIGLKVLLAQEQQIETNWPANYPKITFTKSGKLLCSLRSDDKKYLAEGGAEKSCVQGSLSEISHLANLNLSENDITKITTDMLQAMVKGRFKLNFVSGTHKCENDKTVYWGISAVAEALENDKDTVLYHIGVSMR